ncbi:beta-N-acetylhexosaminidase [Streptomyces amakusaensis]|uniref:beta-N-acetylhexosaminidase n=1 Tax=Streptomyces amakusaensis TaxID=67271 RepID=A0ABW0ABE4_9ACTN
MPPNGLYLQAERGHHGHDGRPPTWRPVKGHQPVSLPGNLSRPLGALGRVIPAPASVQPADGVYTLTAATPIRVDGSAGARTAGDYLAGVLRPATGYPLPVTAEDGADGVRLRLDAEESGLGEEGYRLEAAEGALTLTAREPAGLFHAVQTLRQLLPPALEETTEQPGPWTVPQGVITDVPKYAYRGGMLDVARHFFTVAQVKRYIDHLARYKFNKLHLHLTDDQGWRIAIDSWPELTVAGAATAVGGGPGGHYTKAEYTEIVEYAAARHLEVVPEIDVPGHTSAALASYPELNPDGVAPEVHTGIKVGFSSLTVDKEVTYDFLDDVIREIAEITPGPYLHIGGDEADATSAEDYAAFMDRAQALVVKHGKTVIAWHQLAGARPVPGALAQYWGFDGTSPEERAGVRALAEQGVRLILSPADHVYLDHKYTGDDELGLQWAGLVEVDRSYDWDPASYLEGLPEDAVLGVETALWTETVETEEQLEYLVFPRLLSAAERAWSSSGDWDDFKSRLAAQAPRWDALGINYHKSPTVPWGEV